MRQDDLRAMCQLLAELVERLGRTSRELEELLAIGHGNIGKLLRGKIELRYRHLLAFAELLGVPPGELVAAGSPRTTAAATRHLASWLPAEARGETAAAEEPLPVTLQELRELVRAEVRRELAVQRAERTAARPARKAKTPR